MKEYIFNGEKVSAATRRLDYQKENEQLCSGCYYYNEIEDFRRCLGVSNVKHQTAREICIALDAMNGKSYETVNFKKI